MILTPLLYCVCFLWRVCVTGAVGSGGFYVLMFGVPGLMLIPLITALISSAVSPVGLRKRATIVKPYVPPAATSTTDVPSGAYAPLADDTTAVAPATTAEVDPRYKWQVNGNAYLWNLGGAGAAPLRVNFAGKAPPMADYLLKLPKGAR
jgi:hypothetical protein